MIRDTHPLFRCGEQLYGAADLRELPNGALLLGVREGGSVEHLMKCLCADGWITSGKLGHSTSAEIAEGFVALFLLECANARPATETALAKLDRLEAHARLGDPQTSHEAARAVAAREVARKVLAIFANQDAPISDEQLTACYADAYDAPAVSSSYRSRRSELANIGLVKKAGRGKNKAGRRVRLWQISEKGREVYELIRRAQA